MFINPVVYIAGGNHQKAPIFNAGGLLEFAVLNVSVLLLLSIQWQLEQLEQSCVHVLWLWVLVSIHGTCISTCDVNHDAKGLSYMHGAECLQHTLVAMQQTYTSSETSTVLPECVHLHASLSQSGRCKQETCLAKHPNIGKDTPQLLSLQMQGRYGAEID